MKKERVWPQFIRNLLIMVGSRSRPQLRRPTWIIVLVAIVCVFLIAAYIYPPLSPSSCSLFSSHGCGGGGTFDLPPTARSRELSDAEIESRLVINEILNYYPVQTRKPKVAFLFLTPGSLPFEKLWHMFFKGHEGKFSIYIHASKEKPMHVSPYFVGRDIRSESVGWGKISMVEAERRLLANALLDPDNQHFVLLSESYVDPGPHGNGRYIEHMLPEVEKKDFRKGSQMLDPGGIANWSVTYVDWSEGKWHPRSFRARDITYQVMKNIAYIDESPHFTSDAKRTVVITPCVLNGSKRSCYLFARKFFPEAQDRLIQLFSNSTIF
ncbi:hypothetical protein CR513_49390, partial [Mucuna pruriens]